MTLQGQVESEQTTSSQIQSRLTEVIEDKETISHTNSQLLAKVKVRLKSVEGTCCPYQLHFIRPLGYAKAWQLFFNLISACVMAVSGSIHILIFGYLHLARASVI